MRRRVATYVAVTATAGIACGLLLTAVSAGTAILVVGLVAASSTAALQQALP